MRGEWRRETTEICETKLMSVVSREEGGEESDVSVSGWWWKGGVEGRWQREAVGVRFLTRWVFHTNAINAICARSSPPTLTLPLQHYTTKPTADIPPTPRSRRSKVVEVFGHGASPKPLLLTHYSLAPTASSPTGLPTPLPLFVHARVHTRDRGCSAD